MKTRIVRIGNSQGVRLPRPLLETAGLGEDVLLDAPSATRFDREEWEWR